MTKELIIYCDESEKRGEYFSNFYGGALIRSEDLEEAARILEKCKKALNLNGEVKFQKITENYVNKYMDLMNYFFDLIAQDKIKVRIMFTQNYFKVKDLDAYQRENEYFMLYYQFIKHGFGLRYANFDIRPLRVRLLLDQLPDTKEKAALFKNYILSLSDYKQFKEAKIIFEKEHIAEIESHNHVILQCLDVVLGAMQFRLNNKHKEKPFGKSRRGKRTRAKEKIYKEIHRRINEMHNNFNVGISTGKPDGMMSLWAQSYRHWLFKPKNYDIDKTKKKK